MSTSDTKPEEKQRSNSDRRDAKGRRASDQSEVSDDSVDEVNVPDQRRRKAVRRSGSDRRDK
ncbi:hypothetical protein V5T82_08130 [Magnetovibrio sp. PR-2]|uniref:hypothetical protein n=1 Tax=Magnetovibrio sp. PR-2 TaxID=3120356 RepID=UPI002FCDF1ED